MNVSKHKLHFLFASLYAFLRQTLGDDLPNTYTAFNFVCFRGRNCGARDHDSGRLDGLSAKECFLRCRRDPSCISSLHWSGYDPGTCWLDYSLASVCRSNEAAWTEETDFTYCVATCPMITASSGVIEIDYAPSNIVAMPAAGVVATLKCSIGFRPSGSASAKCQSNGLWSEPLTCIVDDDDTGLKSLLPG